MFVRTFAPDGALSVKAIAAVLRDACDAQECRESGRIGCGTPSRRSCSRSARRGQIAPLLRHTNLSSTAIYAKVDRTALRVLARPWPLAGART